MTDVGKITAVLTIDDSKFDSTLRQDESKWRNFSNKLSSPINIGIATGAAMAGIGLLISAASQLVDLIGPKAAVAWEAGMGNVFKTTNLDAGTQSAAQMNDELLQLRETMRGVTSADIQQGAGILGSLGISNDQIQAADRIVLQATAAFDGLNLEQSAKQLGGISNMWREQTAEIGGTAEMMQHAGSAVNALGNDYASTEANILQFLNAFGGTATQYGMGVQETAALGSLFETKMIGAAEAETAMRSGLMEGLLSSAVETSKTPRGYKLAAQMLGIGDAEMKQRLSNDLAGTVIDIVDAVDKQGTNAAEKTQLGGKLFGAYGWKGLSKLTGSKDEYQEMLGTSNEAFAEGTSLQEEYARQTDNVAGAMDELYGAMEVADITAWSSKLGPAKDLIEGLADVVRGLTTAMKTGDWSEFTSALTDLQSKIRDALVGADWAGMAETAIGLLASALQQAISTAIDIGSWIAEKLATADQASFFNAGEDIGEWVGGGIKSFFSGGAGGIAQAIFDFLNNIVGPSITGIISGLEKSLEPSLAKLYNSFVDWGASVVGLMAGVGWDIENAIVGALNAAQSAAINSINWMGRNVPGFAAGYGAVTGTGGGVRTDTGYLDYETSQSKKGNKVYTVLNMATGEKYGSTSDPAVAQGWIDEFNAGSGQDVHVSSIGQNLGNDSRLADVFSELYSLKWGLSDDAGKILQNDITGNYDIHEIDEDANKIITAIDESGEEEIDTAPLGSTVGQKMSEGIKPVENKLSEGIDATKSGVSNTISSLDTIDYDLIEGFDKIASMQDTREERVANATAGAKSLAKSILSFDDELFPDVDVLKDGIFETADKMWDLSDGFTNWLNNVKYANTSSEKLAVSVEQAADSIEESTSKYNASLNYLTGRNGEFGEAMSEFGTMQELNADIFFNQGYIGPSGENYEAFLQQEAARGAIHPGVNVLGYDYTSQNKPATVQLGIDYTEADAGVTTVQGKASTKQTMPLSLDTGSATSDLEAISDSAQTEKKMPIELEGVAQAQAIIDQLTAPATKVITIVTMSSGGGGGGGGSSSSNWISDTVGSAIADYLDFPAFGEGDVFVGRPTLAVVGDRPGGEWIGGLDQARARFGGGGSGSQVTIDARLIINAPIYGVADLEERFAAHTREIEAIAAQKQWW